MKKLILSLLMISPYCLFAQIGIKGGLNYANVTKTSSINNSSRTGFHAGLFLAPASRGIISSRTELIFSRQGYNYQSSTNTGTVDLDYILLPQFMSINITKYFSLQFGAQMAILLNAKVDSAKNTAGSNGAGSENPYGGIMDLYNRFDYGYAAGFEVHPIKGLLIGARANISLGKLYKDAQSGKMPSFSSVNIKNNVFQLFAGWRFGDSGKKKSKPDQKNPQQ